MSTANQNRIRELEQQLIICELSGKRVKASLLRGSISARKIKEAEEQVNKQKEAELLW